jgi:signal transduction histidine kinase
MRAATTSARLLVVDDEATILELLSGSLRLAGFEVVTAASGGGRLTVADRGPGMTREQASRVFERFYRTDDARTRASGGTGLGLAIASSLAAAHGGELTVDTEPGHGAAFHLRLPQPETLQATATRPQA